MEEIIYQKTYQEFKQECDRVVKETAESFVRLGYLLKVARDTNVLEESGYKTVAEFAEAEYSLNSTYVSRFIAINDRFAEGGYSDKLDSKYQGYGYAKLTVMLQLPESMNEELTPEMTKAEITELKNEFDAEKETSDIERLCEGTNPLAHDLEDVDERSKLLYETVLALGETSPELYIKIAAIAWADKTEELVRQLPIIMVPSDTRIYSVRVTGKGRMMLACSEEKVSIINSRTGEKETYDWNDVAAAWIYAGVASELPFDKTPEEKWEKRYEKKYPVAPVQEPKPKKETRVVKAEPEEEPESQVPGQMDFTESCPEILPEDYEAEETANKIQENENESQEFENKIQEVDNEDDDLDNTNQESDTVQQDGFPDEVERAREDVISLIDGIRNEVCKPDVTSTKIRELQSNSGYLVGQYLQNLARALYDYELTLPDEEEDE